MGMGSAYVLAGLRLKWMWVPRLPFSVESIRHEIIYRSHLSVSVGGGDEGCRTYTGKSCHLRWPSSSALTLPSRRRRRRCCYHRHHHLSCSCRRRDIVVVNAIILYVIVVIILVVVVIVFVVVVGVVFRRNHRCYYHWCCRQYNCCRFCCFPS